MWKQRYEVVWLKERDMNSKFFHIEASNYRHKNRIASLQNAMGLRLKGDLLDTYIVDYFQTLFSTNTDKGRMDFLSKIDSRVNETMKADLSLDFTEDELLFTLKQIHLTKAPGLDGMPPLFF